MQFFAEFQHAIKTCMWYKFATFKGRASPKEFWLFMLFLLLLHIAMGGILSLIYMFTMLISAILPLAGMLVGGTLILLLIIFLCALFIPILAVTARRLHDRDMSAWWLFLMFVPTIGQLLLLIICIFEGSLGPNRFGSRDQA